MNGIVISVICVTAVGLFVGIFLGIAGKLLNVRADERENRILEALPGANCGCCGKSDCLSLAHAILTGEKKTNACPVGGERVSEEIAHIMGEEVQFEEPKAAFVKCAGTCVKAKDRYIYTGQTDCKMLEYTPGGGPKACEYGCLGGGTCVRVCLFDAIRIIDGIAWVDPEKCKACGRCVENCPRQLIELRPRKNEYAVLCASKDGESATMEACTAGCVGCGLCEKACPEAAIHVEDHIAHIDYEKCVNCGSCAENCPQKVILKVEGTA